MKRLGIIAAIAFAPTVLIAQGMPVVPYAANFAQTLQNQSAWQPGVNAAIRQANQKKALNAQPKVVQSASAAALIYRSDPARRRANTARFVNELRKTDPVNANAFEQQFSATDLFAAVGAAISTYGLSLNNLSDVYTIYWVSAWELSRGIIGSEPDKQTMQAVKRQAAEAMLSSPAFAKVSDKDKQELAEALLFQTLLFSAAAELEKSNPARVKAIGAAVAQGAKSVGLDLFAMDLTPTGFVPAKGRKGADASGVGAEGDIALASADTTASTPAPGNAPSNPLSGTLATYALIAAAGGAGLGGVYLLGRASAKKG